MGRLRRIAVALMGRGVAWAMAHASTGLPNGAGQPQAAQLKSMSLEQRGNVEVTTVSKQVVWHTPAAVYVLTREDIEWSEAKTIPDLLRLVPANRVGIRRSVYCGAAVDALRAGRAEAR